MTKILIRVKKKVKIAPLEVEIIDDNTSAPIPGGTVLIFQGDNPVFSFKREMDITGKMTEMVPEGTYRVQFQHPDYFTEEKRVEVIAT